MPAQHATRGFHGVTLSEEGYERTAELLQRDMGFQPGPSFGNRFRFTVGEGEAVARVDLLCQPAGRRGTVAAGTVHHIAWRAADDAAQLEWRAKLVELGYNVTPVLDRQYFHSIYYREPGGVLFEIATDLPGFLVDEALPDLGARLQLPPWLESSRGAIEQSVPPIQLPDLAGAAAR